MSSCIKVDPSFITFLISECSPAIPGCADFVPCCTDVGSQFASTTFETFGEVVAKASGWVGQQMSVRITNIQSIDYKLQHGWGKIRKEDLLLSLQT